MAKRRKVVDLPENLRGTLARNLETILTKVPALNSQPKIAAKGKLGQSSVGRVFRAEVAVNIDNVEGLAKAANLQPWQLLVPDLDPHRPPSLGAGLAIEEGEALSRLRGAIPGWRAYVLSLASMTHSQQKLFLDSMREAVPDSWVEEANKTSPHGQFPTRKAPHK